MWTATGYTCYAGAHLALTVVASTLAALLVALCATYVLVFYDSHPLSSSLQAKRTGRADAVAIVIKAAAVAIVEVFPATFGPTGLCAVLVTAAVTLVIVAAVYLPFTHRVMNRILLGCYVVFAYSTLALIVCVAVTPLKL